MFPAGIVLENVTVEEFLLHLKLKPDRLTVFSAMYSDLDSLLSLDRERPVPTLPGSFTGDVLREIRQRQGEPASILGWWIDLLDFAMQPARLAVALAVALVVSSLVSYSIRPAPIFSRPDLGVFSSATLNLPSGRLEHTP